MDRQLDYRRPLNDKAKRQMFVIIFQSAELMELLSDRFDPQTWPAEDRVYSVLWSISHKYFEEHGGLIPDDLCVAELEQAMDEDEDLLTETEREIVQEILEDIYDRPPLGAVGWAKQKVKEYLQRLIALETQEVLVAGDATPSGDLPAMLTKLLQRSEQVDTLDIKSGGMLFGKGWDKRIEIVKTNTGLEFLNYFTNGGTAPKELYGVIAPYGTCKTTLAIQLTANRAKQGWTCWNKWSASNGQKRVLQFSVYVSYEAPIDEVRQRVLGYVARIPRKYIDDMADLNNMSTTDNLRDYERRMFKDAIRENEQIYAEQDRIRRATAWLNRHMLYVDMTGSDDSKKDAAQGMMGIREIRAHIDARRRMFLNQGIVAIPNVIVIDYVNAAVRAYMEAHDISGDRLRHEIGGFPIRCKRRLAVPYDCPVVLLQQFSGEANAKKPVATLHHTEAAECKSFGENLDFCIVVGNLDESQRGMARCTKHRRYKPMPPTCVQVRGEWNKVEWAPNFVADIYSGKIVHVDELEGAPGAPKAQTRRDKRGHNNVLEAGT